MTPNTDLSGLAFQELRVDPTGHRHRVDPSCPSSRLCIWTSDILRHRTGATIYDMEQQSCPSRGLKRLKRQWGLTSSCLHLLDILPKLESSKDLKLSPPLRLPCDLPLRSPKKALRCHSPPGPAKPSPSAGAPGPPPARPASPPRAPADAAAWRSAGPQRFDEGFGGWIHTTAAKA